MGADLVYTGFLYKGKYFDLNWQDAIDMCDTLELSDFNEYILGEAPYYIGNNNVEDVDIEDMRNLAKESVIVIEEKFDGGRNFGDVSWCGYTYGFIADCTWGDAPDGLTQFEVVANCPRICSMGCLA
jgi:hypothetical protein